VITKWFYYLLQGGFLYGLLLRVGSLYSAECGAVLITVSYSTGYVSKGMENGKMG